MKKRLTAFDRRAEILAAAVQLFSAKGFGRTTTAELARRAGISEALLFRHFPTKKKLYQAILAAKMEEQIPNLLQDLPMKEDLQTTLMELALRIARQNEKDPSFMRLLLFSALEGHELSDLFFQRRTLPLLEFLKFLPVRDPETAARTFLGMVFNLVQTRLIFRVPQVVKKPLEPSLRNLVSIFLKGILTVGLVMISFASWAEGPLTIHDCFEKTLVHYEEVAIQEEEIRAAEGRYRQALGTALPQVTAKGSEFVQDVSGIPSDATLSSAFFRQSRPEAAINLKQPLFQGFREFRSISGASADKEKSRFDTKRAEELLYVDVARSFLLVKQLEEEQRIVSGQLETMKRRVAELSGRVRLGKSRPSEVTATEAELASVAADVDGVKGRLQSARENLAFLTGIPNDTPLAEPEDSPAPLPPLTAYLDHANVRSDVQSAGENLQLSKAKLGYFEGGHFPNLNLEGNYYPYRVGFQSDIKWDLLFTLNVPIFSGGITSGQVREAKARLHQADLARSESERRAAMEIRNAYHDLEAARAQEESLKVAAAKRQATYQSSLKEYRLGLINNLEVLQAARDWLISSRADNAARQQRRLSEIILKGAAGELP